MAEARAHIEAIGHPAPHRARVRLGLIAFGLMAAPLAWGAQLVINYALASHACFPGGRPLQSVALGWGAVWSVLFVVELITLAIALAGAAAAHRSWRATRAESYGNTEEMTEAGRGRTRFLSLWGLMTSLGFSVAIGFSLIGLFAVPLCGF
jgi:hypothetical protein